MDRFFDEFAVGDAFDSDGMTVSEAAILDFAARYDPQPFHLDAAAAAHSPFGGLIASGIQSIAVALRLFLDEKVLRACSVGSPGIDEVRFKKPVRPGDTLRTRATILDTVPSRGRPDRGLLRIGYALTNQAGEEVMTMQIMHLVVRRPPEPPAAS